MSRVRLLLFCSLMMLSGCTWPVRQRTDRVLRDLASYPIDVAPPEAKTKTENETPASKKPDSATNAADSEPATDLHTTALMLGERDPDNPSGAKRKYELDIPEAIPGSETPALDFKKLTPEQKQQAIRRLYPELPPLPAAPKAVPGPAGRSYTLADLQRLAAENSPALRQAVADVAAAEGALVQAKTYPNPTIGPFYLQPNNNNSATGAWGMFLQQPLPTFGKKKMQVAAAQKELDNAKLALRRARFDLSTNVRNAYFALIVAKETVRVNQALARFTEEIYRLYTGYLAGGFAAPYEPAPLRAQAYAIRLAYKQALTGYIYAWKQLVAMLGLPQLPLTEVAGRVDRLIPY